MKKIAVILIMFLLLFNLFGYKLVLNYFQKNADYQLESRIDLNDYDESQLIEIRIALNLPYQNAWTEFERCYGEIEIDGKYYTYVKRKVEENFLILKCIPNHQKQVLKNTGNVLFEALNGIDQEKSSTPLKSFVKNILTDYDDHLLKCDLQVVKESNSHWLNLNNTYACTTYMPVCEQPPENFSLS